MLPVKPQKVIYGPLVSEFSQLFCYDSLPMTVGRSNLSNRTRTIYNKREMYCKHSTRGTSNLAIYVEESIVFTRKMSMYR